MATSGRSTKPESTHDSAEARIRRQFAAFGVVIEHLLSLSPVPLELVKKKLVQLDLALGAQILTEARYVKLGSVWKRRMAKFWAMYRDAFVSATAPPLPAPKTPCEVSVDNIQGSSKSSLPPIPSSAESVRKLFYPLKKSTTRAPFPTNESTICSAGNFDFVFDQASNNSLSDDSSFSSGSEGTYSLRPVLPSAPPSGVRPYNETFRSWQQRPPANRTSHRLQQSSFTQKGVARYRREPSAPPPPVPSSRSLPKDILSIPATDSIPAMSAHLEQVYGSFTPIRNGELSRFQTLTTMLAKTCRLVYEHLEDGEFEERVFAFAFAKLPTEKQQLYEMMHTKSSLRSLLLFLVNHVSSCLGADKDGAVMAFPCFDPPEYPLCFKCFTIGHLIKECRQEPMLRADWFDFESFQEDEGGPVSERTLHIAQNYDDLDWSENY